MIEIALKKELFGANGSMYLDLNITIKKGEFIALTGASGAGKTTFLRALAGLEKAQGSIVVHKQIWQNDTTFLPVQKRDIGFVFQDYALFEHMSVLQNLLFVKKDLSLAQSLLAITELTELQDRYPKHLSGGQKQRVSIARAMMRKPQLLLLDEPLSALDATMRAKLQEEILLLHQRFGTTTIMISHDRSEIYKLAARVLVLDGGKIIADGTPKHIFLQHNTNHHHLILEADILEILPSHATTTPLIVAIDKEIIEITLPKEQAKSLSLGDTIMLHPHNFTLLPQT